jgi:ABC-type multidrug transport system ATPase subunit
VRTLKINPLIVTLGMAAILRGLAYVVTGARSVTGFPEGFIALGRTSIGPIPLPVIVGATVFVVGGYLLLRTVAGLRVYAVGGNARSANLAGVDSDGLVMHLFALNGALIGLVAALTTARLGSAQAAIGLGFELDVLTAVILGGVAFNGGGGHPFGVFVGVVTIGILNAGIIFAGVPDFWQQITRGSVLLLALAGDQLAVRRRERARAPALSGELASDAPPTGADPPAGADPPDQAERHASQPPNADVAVDAASRRRAEPRRRSARPASETTIACHDLKKSYGSVAAVRGVTFHVAAGEVVCLVGDNGAGKSTVIKMLSGAVVPDSGTIEVRGRRVALTSPSVARAHGIETAYQDLALCPNLGAAHNLVLGAEPRAVNLGPLSIRDDRRGKALARSRLAELGIVLDDLDRPVGLLSGGQRQSVAIARIAGEGVSVVILDEPTAALGVKQTRNVLDLVRVLADRGAAVILISHDIDTVFEVADRVVVLRLGRVVHEGSVDDLTTLDLVHLMAGLGTPLQGGRDRATDAPPVAPAPAVG